MSAPARYVNYPEAGDRMCAKELTCQTLKELNKKASVLIVARLEVKLLRGTGRTARKASPRQVATSTMYKS